MPQETMVSKLQRSAQSAPLRLPRAGGVVRLLAKRLFDIGLSLAILGFLLPLVALTILALYIEDRGPILFREVRIGLTGRHFQLLRLRTSLPEDEGGDWIGVADNAPAFTALGTLLHLTRIDQIPQLFNILRGDMSFVGPRPERPRTVSALAHRLQDYSHRHQVRPGLTGYAQLQCPTTSPMADAERKLTLDLAYIDEQSLWRDVKILIDTLLFHLLSRR